MTQKPFNIALIGCGGMSRLYAHKYQEIEGARLALLVDTSEEIARSASQRLGGVPWTLNFQDALKPEIDLIDISTPNFLHRQQALAAIAAGKHVLLQKPLAPSVEDAEAIVQAASSSRRCIGMYMSDLNQPTAHDLRKALDRGLLGRVSSVHCRCAHPGGLNMSPGGWRNDIKKCGGGSFIQLAIHHLFLMEWLLRDRIQSVMAYADNLMCPSIGGDDVAIVACAFESGILGAFESAYCAAHEEYAVFGSEGFFRFDEQQELTIKLNAAFQGETFSYAPEEQVKRLSLIKTHAFYQMDNPYDQNIAFVKAAMEGRPPMVSVQEGLRDNRIVRAVYESARTHKRVTVREEG